MKQGMRYAMITVVLNVPVQDKSGQIIGTNQHESTRSLPYDTPLEDVATLVSSLGSHKVMIIFETEK